MNLKKWIIFFILGMFLTGCMGVGKKAKVIYPKWFNSVPSDNSYFYGMGNGKNEKEAVNVALSSIASKISIEISSTFESEVQSSTTSYSSSSRKNINSRVSNIKFNNYKILKQEMSGDMVFVLLKVDKMKLTSSMRERIMMKMDSFDGKIANFTGSSFQKLKVLKKVSLEVGNLEKDFLITDTIIAQGDKNTQLSRLHNYVNIYQDFKNRTTFCIKNSQQSREYGKALANIITQKGYNVVPSPTKDSIVIYLNVTEHRIKALGKSIIKSNINLKLVDGNLLNDNFSFESAGSSVRSYETAKELSIKNFEKKIKGVLDE